MWLKLKKLFRKWLVKRIVKEARSQLSLFKYLQTSDFDAKHRLLPQARHFEIQLSAVTVWENLIEDILVLPIRILAALILIGAPFIVALWFHLNLSWAWIFYLLLYELVVFLVYYLILVLPVIRLSSYSLAPWMWIIGVLFVCVALLYRIASTGGINPPTLLTTFIASILLGQFSIITAVIINGILIVFSKSIRSFLYPNAVLVDGFLQILHLAQAKPGQWADLAFKRQLTTKLEEIAQCVQYDLPRQLSSGDANTDTWLKEIATEIATALRALKKLVLISNPDSRSQFLEDISANLIYATNSNWGALKRTKPETYTITQTWHKNALKLFRTLMIASIPLLMIWVIQQTPFALQGKLIETIVVVGVFWAIMTLLAAFDPLYIAKIGTLKDIIPFLPMLGRDKK